MSEENYLQHYNAVYDPIKAHEYYMRTRKLKGRKLGQHLEPLSKNAGKAVTESLVKKNATKPIPVTHPKIKTPEQQRRDVEFKVKRLKAELKRLHAILRRLLNQSQGRIVVDAKGKPVSSTSKTAKPAGKASADSRKLTAAQKREAAKRSKEYYQKHKTEISATEKEKQLKAQIHETGLKIAKARSDLKASVARAQHKITNLNRQQ